MKPAILFSIVAACALTAFVGCSKREEAPAAPQTPGLAANAAQRFTQTVQAQTEVVKETAKETATNVQTQANVASDKVQALIEQAKALVDQNKLSEALSLLNSLSGQQLSAEQQSLVQKLKEQIQKLSEAAIKTEAGDEAAKTIGGLRQPQ